MKDDLEPQMNDDDLMNFKELNRPLKDDLEREVNDDNSTPSPKRRKTESDGNRLLPTMIVVLLVLIFAGGIIYFLSKGSTGGGESLLQLKVTALEQKIAGLEQQLAELQGKITTSGKDPALLQQVNALARKVESPEKQKQPVAESKGKPSPPSKPTVSTEKKYHTVQKGETLHLISKKYGISVEELRKRNNLSADQPIRTGQKLLVSTGR